MSQEQINTLLNKNKAHKGDYAAKKIVLCSVPGSSVINPSNEEREYWNNYLTLLEHEGAYTVSKKNLEYLGNSSHQNIGLLHLGGILKQRGHEVVYIAAKKDSTNEEIESSVIENARNADFVGYSFHTCGEPLAEKIAGSVKRRYPKIIQLAGGPHVSGFDIKPLNKNIDVYFKGRSHMTLPWFIEQNPGLDIASKDSGPSDYFGENAPKSFPNPDNSLMDVKNLPAIRIYTSLGCGKKKPCTFCGSIVDHRQYICGDIGLGLKNLDNLMKRYNPEFIYIGDEDFFRNPSHSQKIVNRLEAEYKGRVKYSIQASVETLKKNKGLLEVIGKAGMCKEIQVGVESADQQILDTANKEIRISEVSEVGKRVKEQGIKFFGYWLSWLPGETIDTHEKTTDLICKMLDTGGAMDYAEAIIVVPFPGTELDKNKEKYGLKIVDKDYSHWRGENPPVFVYENGIEREKMYSLYLNRIKQMAGILKKRMPPDAIQKAGVDPFKVMTGF